MNEAEAQKRARAQARVRFEEAADGYAVFVDGKYRATIGANQRPGIEDMLIGQLVAEHERASFDLGAELLRRKK